MRERRRDPRTDAHFSLRNLLRTRVESLGYSLAVLGTPEGMLMVGSREDRPAQRVAAHAARELRCGRLAFCDRFSSRGARTGGRMEAFRFEHGGKALVLAILDAAGAGVGGSEIIDEIAERICAILGESRILPRPHEA